MSSDRSTDRWDFYSCEIEGKPHSTMINLCIFDIAPVQNLSLFHCLEVKLKCPNPENGMTTDEEFQPLSAMEDLIEQSNAGDLRYIARQTGDGKRKFYFYSSPDFDFASLIFALDQAFPDYEKATFDFEDSRWKTYFENLYPNAIGMNEISNRSVFLQLEENGDDLNIPRVIDHTVTFEDRRRAKDFSMAAEARGFTVEIKSRGIFKKMYDLLVQRVDTPSGLDPITYELQELAASFGGSYDGWGCLVKTSSD